MSPPSAVAMKGVHLKAESAGNNLHGAVVVAEHLAGDAHAQAVGGAAQIAALGVQVGGTASVT